MKNMNIKINNNIIIFENLFVEYFIEKNVKTIYFILLAQVAQSVEQGTENPCVGGSIPPLGTIIRL